MIMRLLCLLCCANGRACVFCEKMITRSFPSPGGLRLASYVVFWLPTARLVAWSRIHNISMLFFFHVLMPPYPNADRADVLFFAHSNDRFSRPIGLWLTCAFLFFFRTSFPFSKHGYKPCVSYGCVLNIVFFVLCFHNMLMVYCFRSCRVSNFASTRLNG